MLDNFPPMLALPVKKFGSIGSLCLPLGRKMTDRTTCEICFFPFQTEGRGAGCNPLRAVRTTGMAFPVSECKGSTATGLWVLPYSPRHVGQDLRGDKNVSSPSRHQIKPGCFSVRNHVDAVGAAKHGPVSCRAEKPWWFLFHKQMCSSCGEGATDI